jgi:hypothetical protein
LEKSTTKCALSTVKPSISHWHESLGHPLHVVVQRVLDTNNLAFSRDPDPVVVCDACQCAKSHQLPFARSLSVYSDVWGPAPSSVGRNNYYVNFIDVFSKFTWIYLLKHKSEVFAKFHTFQQHVERLLNCKIISIQTDWERQI